MNKTKYAIIDALFWGSLLASVIGLFSGMSLLALGLCFFLMACSRAILSRDGQIFMVGVFFLAATGLQHSAATIISGDWGWIARVIAGPWPIYILAAMALWLLMVHRLTVGTQTKAARHGSSN